MPKAETSSRGRLSEEEAARVRRIKRSWTESEHRRAVFYAEGAELCRRFLLVSMVFWSALVFLTQALALMGWTGGAPYDYHLPPWVILGMGLGLWIVQGCLGVWAYGPFGDRPLRDLIGAGLPVWGCAWAVHRFVVRSARRPRMWRGSARAVLAYLLVATAGWLVLGLVGLTANGGIGDWPPPVAGAVLVTASLVGTFGARRYWATAASSPERSRPRRALSIWAWWVPVVGPFWALWQLLEEESPGNGSSLIFRAYGGRTALSARPRWDHARDTLGSAWQKGSWMGRWIRWRDRPNRGKSSRIAEDQFRRLCHDKKDLLFAEGVLLGWWWSEEGHLGVGARGELLDAESVAWFSTSVWGLGGIALLGLASALGCLLRRGPEPVPLLGQHQIGGFLASSWFVLSMGLVVGICVVPTEPRITVELASMALLSLLLLRVLSGLVQGFASGSLGVRNLFASGPVSLTGLLAGAAALAWFLASGAPFYWWLAALVCGGVLGGTVLLWRHGASLVHPLRLSDLTRRGLPWRARVWLVFLPLTMVLPGGGLAVPVWVWMRLRWWKGLVATRKALATAGI